MMAARRASQVVLSRLMDIVTEQPVDTAALMQRVIAQNPNSYPAVRRRTAGSSLCCAGSACCRSARLKLCQDSGMNGAVAPDGYRHGAAGGYRRADAARDRAKSQ
jgi:hypothetical protein